MSIAWVVWPFSLMLTYISSLLATFFYFIFIFFPTWPCNTFNKYIDLIWGSCNSSSSLLDFKLLELRWSCPLSDLEGWINDVNVSSVYFCKHSLTMFDPLHKKHLLGFGTLHLELRPWGTIFLLFNCKLLHSGILK